MKRIFALILALLLMLAFAACGQEAENTDPAEETSEPENAESEAETEIPEETPALYEEMLVNFGGTYRHDGSIIVNRKGSFYDLREGIEDCSAMTADSYYTWVVSRTENSDKIKVMLSGFDSEVYAYSADFYEGEIAKYFGVSAEELRACDYYYADQNCYYYEGVPAAGDYVSVEYVSAEEIDDTVAINFTLTDANGSTNHVLTVKILPDGGYNYLSYLPA
ncbi:MAG: hypothetical protein IJ945_08340 [Oscillospiraceae bacterium]|nr:hypothetical protein [Oscillospiraceae bacterium]